MGSEIALLLPLYFGQIGSLESSSLSIYLLSNIFIEHNKKGDLIFLKIFSMAIKTWMETFFFLRSTNVILHTLPIEKIFEVG